MKTNEYTFQPSYNRIINKDQLAVGGLNGLRDTALGQTKDALQRGPVEVLRACKFSHRGSLLGNGEASSCGSPELLSNAMSFSP